MTATDYHPSIKTTIVFKMMAVFLVNFDPLQMEAIKRTVILKKVNTEFSKKLELKPKVCPSNASALLHLTSIVG